MKDGNKVSCDGGKRTRDWIMKNRVANEQKPAGQNVEEVCMSEACPQNQTLMLYNPVLNRELGDNVLTSGLLLIYKSGA